MLGRHRQVGMVGNRLQLSRHSIEQLSCGFVFIVHFQDWLRLSSFVHFCILVSLYLLLLSFPRLARTVVGDSGFPGGGRALSFLSLDLLIEDFLEMLDIHLLCHPVSRFLAAELLRGYLQVLILVAASSRVLLGSGLNGKLRAVLKLLPGEQGLAHLVRRCRHVGTMLD